MSKLITLSCSLKFPGISDDIIAVIDAAKEPYTLCNDDLGIDKPELASLRCALNRLTEGE